jgi:Nif-specific regulatory protein
MTVHAEHLQINDALILEATRVIASQSVHEQKIPALLRLLSEWAHLHCGRVLMPNYAIGELQVAFSYGLNRERLQSGEYSVPFNQGLTGAVWRTGQLALVTDVMDEPMFLTRIAEPLNGNKAGVGFISAPIIMDGKPIAVLSVQRRSEERRLYSQDVDLLRVIAGMMASVLVLLEQRGQMSSLLCEGSHDPEHERLHQLCETYGIIGRSQVLMAAVKQIDNAKYSDAPILLLGESGTGKEMFAQMIHRLSARSNGPYVPLNCAAIPEQLLESELFGHEKGSFTGAHRNKKGKLQQASEGTLFLDEIGDLQLDLQVKLLRVLQDRQVEPVGGDKPVQVNFRIITATHINLRKAIEAGRFRLDLFFRLNVVPIYLPPLRERTGDIPLLVDFFLQRYQGMYRRNLTMGTGTMDRLCHYPWPGNIRQLQNVIERAVLQAEGPWISDRQIEQILADEGGFPLGTVESSVANRASAPEEFAAPLVVAEIPRYRPYTRVENGQRQHIEQALKQTGGNQTRAAALLGLTLRQLRYRVMKLGD